MTDRPPHKYTQKQLQLFSIIFFVFCIVVAVLSFVTVGGLPSIEQLENPKPELATRVYSVDGELIDQYYIKNRTFIKFDSLPKPLIDALIATEDRNFYSHWGVSLTGIIRAVIVDVVTLRMRQGASTITQQLARNLYLTPERSILRKIREALTAVQIERTFTKKEILELYFNVAYFGRGAYGVQAASLIYFGKTATKLSISECAFLVGILKGPPRYDPDTHFERAKNRRNTVLENMYDYGVISSAQYESSRNEGISSTASDEFNSTGMAPHFVEWVRQQLQKIPALAKHDIYRDGLVVYTTLDARMQRSANKAVEEHLKELQPQFNKRWQWVGNGREAMAAKYIEQAAKANTQYVKATTEVLRKKIYASLVGSRSFRDSVLRIAQRIEVGFVAIDPTTGEIRAMVGGSNFREFRYGLNHVTQIQRQPGSAFKPFCYASAIQHGYTPDFRLAATPFTYTMPDGQVWTPQNTEEDKFEDTISLRTALKFSVNVVAARVITQLTTPHDVAHLAHAMGIHSSLPEYPSIALGSAEVTPLELTSAYGGFCNSGISCEPYGILSVEDATGKVLYRAKRSYHAALDAGTAHTMTQMMEAVVDGGTGSSIRKFFPLAAAGKTGTTQDFADAWFVGYTPELCAGAWVGFDDRRITFGGWYGQGGKAAAPIWGRFMRGVYAEKGMGFKKFAFTGPEKPGRPPVDSTHAATPPVKSPL